MEAKVIATGNLGNDSQVVNFENGNAVITFSIATNSYFKNADGEKVQKTTWHECKRYVKEVNQKLVDMLSKGTHVTILGELKYEEFEKEVTAKKSVNIKKAYIDVKEIDIV